MPAAEVVTATEKSSLPETRNRLPKNPATGNRSEKKQSTERKHSLRKENWPVRGMPIAPGDPRPPRPQGNL